jgi:hypothetical protein
MSSVPGFLQFSRILLPRRQVPHELAVPRPVRQAQLRLRVAERRDDRALQEFVPERRAEAQDPVGHVVLAVEEPHVLRDAPGLVARRAEGEGERLLVLKLPLERLHLALARVDPVALGVVLVQFKNRFVDVRQHVLRDARGDFDRLAVHRPAFEPAVDRQRIRLVHLVVVERLALLAPQFAPDENVARRARHGPPARVLAPREEVAFGDVLGAKVGRVRLAEHEVHGADDVALARVVPADEHVLAAREAEVEFFDRAVVFDVEP